MVVLVVLARGLHPVSFPNLEVKPFCADGTAAGRSWESRALPTVSLSGGGVDPSGVGTPTTVLFVWWGCVWGWLLDHPQFFCAFRRRQTPVKVVKDTPTVRCQTY